MRNLLKFHLILFLSLGVWIGLSAETTLPALIGDHMVLKQKSKVALWGWDCPGTDMLVRTSWNNRVYRAQADSHGKWSVSVATPEAGGPYRIFIHGTDTIELKNVLIGEVWFTSGQSNMGWSVNEEKRGEDVMKSAAHPNVRLFHVPRQVADRPERGFKKGASWKECNAASVRHFSAMSYYFATLLQENLGVPVGIISASWAGTGIESWLSADLQNADESLRVAVDRWHTWENDFLQDSIDYAGRLSAEKDRGTGEAAAKSVRKPKSMHMLQRPHCKPGALYNGMIAPCLPFTLSGFIWYQGENSVEWAEAYQYQLQKLIDSWREGFRGDAPMLVGQLTNFNYPSPERAAIVREAQLKAQEQKDTHVICTIDIGNNDDVHPDNKLPFGQRFVAMALNKVYRKPAAADYPIAEKAVAKADRIILHFRHAKELHIQGGSLNDMQAVDRTGKRIEVTVTAAGNKLIMQGSGVGNVAKVSYAVGPDVKANLYNEKDLPAFPFTLLVEHKR